MLKCYVLLISLILILIFFSNFAYFLYEINNDQFIYNFEPSSTTTTILTSTTTTTTSSLASVQVVQKETIKKVEECDGNGWELVDDTKCQRKTFYHYAVDQDLVSTTHNPCDNFYNYACKHYTKGEDVFQYLESTYTSRLKDIATDIVTSPHMSTSILTIFNHACSRHYSGQDVQTNISGEAAIVLKMVDTELRSHSDIARVWGKLQLNGIPLPVVMWMDVNPLDGSNQELIPIIGSTRVLNSKWEDSSEWIRSRVFPHMSGVIEEHIVSIDTLLHNELRHGSIGGNLANYLTLFGGMSDILISYSDKEKAFSKFDIFSFITNACPHSDCQHWIDAPWWLSERQFFQRLQSFIYRFPLEAWKSYTKFAIISRFFAAENTTTIPESNVFNSPISTVTNYKDEEDSCLDITLRYLEETIEGYYRNRYVTKKVVNIVEEVFNNLKDTYVTLVGDEIRRKKLQRMKLVIDASVQYPHSLTLGDFHLENVFDIESARARQRYTSSRHYHIQPLAYYRYETNTIHVGLGLLQQPLFSTTFDPMSLYSRLGVVLAHEMTHAFDGIGTYYDASSKFNVDLDIEMEMQEKFNCFIDLYSIQISDNHNTYVYDGVSTMNENVADVIGLDVSFKTYSKLFEYTKEDIISFFLSYAQLYCNSVSNEKQIEKQRVLHFSHSISSLRVNIPVFSQESFNQIFDCGSQQKPETKFFNCTFLN